MIFLGDICVMGHVAGQKAQDDEAQYTDVS